MLIFVRCQIHSAAKLLFPIWYAPSIGTYGANVIFPRFTQSCPGFHSLTVCWPAPTFIERMKFVFWSEPVAGNETELVVVLSTVIRSPAPDAAIVTICTENVPPLAGAGLG